MRKLLLLLVALGIGLISVAQDLDFLVNEGKILNANPRSNVEHRAAGCAPSTALRDLEYNNVKALIETGGSMWQDRSVGRASYEVPKDGGLSVLYAGALWMGGLSLDNQLKLAAVQYRFDGNDYWPGPLTNDGSASVEAEVCSEWDRFFVSERADSQRHRAWFDCQVDPNCDLEEEFPDGYVTPEYFYEYPAMGNLAQGQDFYLAPFLDYNDDGIYDPEQGDYPWYDFLQEINCFERRREDPIPLFGDQTFYWIFNDKGNIHTESEGQPIGMEIRAQAFAFSTNDEVNNMTFYNYTLINQGSTTLNNTYFGTWIDGDIGGHVDDYVGCDVQRGLGYSYNGDAFDDPTGLSTGYGANPPAMGVDFFEGPFQDEDEIDNPLTPDFIEAAENFGIPYNGIGIGYGDSIVDNERYGMRKFVYHNTTSAANGAPNTALEHYNFMQGIWKNNQRMSYGGDGLNPGTGADLSTPADYMFPGDTDPFNWGTLGAQVEPWTEQSVGNPPGDRRFLQSAGPFVLEPGDYNNITVGVVYARANSGDPFRSVELVRLADDKAQALFDNCFEIISGPDAPDVSIREMDKELIIYLSNDNNLSNNFEENYTAIDPGIPSSTTSGEPLTDEDRKYRFEGYLLYQLADDDVSVSDVSDIDKARLIAQCDVENFDEDGNPIGNLVNWNIDPIIGEPVPEVMVEGANEGIRHSFRVTNDAFAIGDTRLVNFKTYYFLALAYGYNNYEEYNTNQLTGQDEMFKASRKAAIGSIRVYSGIPHKVDPEAGGTVLNSSYGTGVQMTKFEGKGNATNVIDITSESEEEILANFVVDSVVYEPGASPVNVRIVDPLRVPKADFLLRINPDNADIQDLDEFDQIFWELINLTEQDTFRSPKAIDVFTEELILEWGLGVSIEQVDYDGDFTELLEATLSFEDPSQPWYQGVSDQEGFSQLNWIRSGTQEAGDDAEPGEELFDDYPDDEGEVYEGLLEGTWAPFNLVSYSDTAGTFEVRIAPTISGVNGELGSDHKLNDQPNVDVVFTSDKSKWTRCMVLEAQFDGDLAQDLDGDIPGVEDIDPEKMRLRRHPSVDKNGRKPGDEGYNEAEATLNGEQPVGMGWFPGYAIDVESGIRLNMAFAEDSWLGSENGRDMIWNPSSNVLSAIGGEVYAGGQHWIYVFKDGQRQTNQENRMPAYDEGRYAYDKMEANFTSSNRRGRVFRYCAWVGSALLNPDYELLSPEEGLIPNEVRVRLRLAKQYDRYSPVTFEPEEDTLGSQNNWNPLYTFSTGNFAATTSTTSIAEDFLDEINVVPNPYYAGSMYETSKIDNRVKLINLPQECVISIYSVNGILVRQFRKAAPETFLDWDLKNERNIPISSGVYVIHIDAGDLGQKVLKWFGVMRPVDLDNF